MRICILPIIYIRQILPTQVIQNRLCNDTNQIETINRSMLQFVDRAVHSMIRIIPPILLNKTQTYKKKLILLILN